MTPRSRLRIDGVELALIGLIVTAAYACIFARTKPTGMPFNALDLLDFDLDLFDAVRLDTALLV